MMSRPDDFTAAGPAALFADLYELRMARACLDLGMHEEAVFSLFVRRLPAERNFLLACGADTMLDLLEGLRFGAHRCAAVPAAGTGRGRPALSGRDQPGARPARGGGTGALRAAAAGMSGPPCVVWETGG